MGKSAAGDKPLPDSQIQQRLIFPRTQPNASAATKPRALGDLRSNNHQFLTGRCRPMLIMIPNATPMVNNAVPP